MKNSSLVITRDHGREGALVMKNEKTIERYFQLREEQRTMTVSEENGIFFAFDTEQFQQGLKRIEKYKQEGDKLIRCDFGMFGYKRVIEEWDKRIKSIDKKIAEECDPQEVYCYEWNNHECMYDFEGDYTVYNIIKHIFGDDAKTIRRWRAVDDPE